MQKTRYFCILKRAPAANGFQLRKIMRIEFQKKDILKKLLKKSGNPLSFSSYLYGVWYGNNNQWKTK